MGIQSDISGELRWYAAGGQGGTNGTGTVLRRNGIGGGGSSGATLATSGTNGTGSGGGGSQETSGRRQAGHGGSGIIIMLFSLEGYPIPTISAVVRDKNGALAEGREVYLIHEGTKEIYRHLYTDSEGKFAVFRPPEGTYTVLVTGEPNRNAIVYTGVPIAMLVPEE
jgi:hypothetical protein